MTWCVLAAQPLTQSVQAGAVHRKGLTLTVTLTVALTVTLTVTLVACALRAAAYPNPNPNPTPNHNLAQLLTRAVQAEATQRCQPEP